MNRSTLFKVICAVPFAVVIGLLTSMVIDRLVDPTIEGQPFLLHNRDFSTSLTTRIGEPLADSSGGLRLCLDPFTIYRNLPNQKNPSFSIDERGFRIDGEHIEAPRAFVLGGSAAFGQGLGPGELPFSARLQKRIPKLQCVNAAVVGHISSQELAMMVHLLDVFEPRLYIVFDGWNDLFDPFCRVKEWPTVETNLGVHSAFVQVETRLLELHRIETGTSIHPGENDRNRTSLVELGSSAFFEQVTDGYVRNIERMDSFARSRGAKLLMVFQPELGQKVHKSMREESHIEYADRAHLYLSNGFSERYTRMVESAMQRCSDFGIPYINLATDGPFVSTKDELFSDFVHLNDLGHELVTISILKSIEEIHDLDSLAVR